MQERVTIDSVDSLWTKRSRALLNQMLKSRVFWFLAPVIGVMLITHLSGSVYQTSDEFELRSTLSGVADAVDGMPYPYVIYMNVLYSTLISCLYRLIPSWYWYDLVMYGVLLCSLVQISWVLLCLYGNKCVWSQLLKLVVIVGVGVIPFLCVQFTMTAGFAAIAGVLMIVAWLDKRSGHDTLMLVLAWASLLTASLIRFSACCSICLLAALLLAPFSWAWVCRAKLRISLF